MNYRSRARARLIAQRGAPSVQVGVELELKRVVGGAK